MAFVWLFDVQALFSYSKHDAEWLKLEEKQRSGDDFYDGVVDQDPVELSSSAENFKISFLCYN